MRPPIPVEKRLKNYVVDDAGCWIWAGSKTDRGYGRLRVAGRTVFAHRVMYELAVGPIPDGLVIDHLCEVTSCINPDHLQATTQYVNATRGIRSNAKKEACKRGHPLTEENVRRALNTNGRPKRECRTCIGLRNAARYHPEAKSCL